MSDVLFQPTHTCLICLISSLFALQEDVFCAKVGRLAGPEGARGKCDDTPCAVLHDPGVIIPVRIWLGMITLV